VRCAVLSDKRALRGATLRDRASSAPARSSEEADTMTRRALARRPFTPGYPVKVQRNRNAAPRAG